MRGAHAVRAALLLAGSFGFCGLAGAGQFVRAHDSSFDARSPALAELENTRTPSGWTALCARDHSFCLPASVAPRDLILSPERWALLSGVNSEVNHAISSATDEKLYGKTEYWTIPTTAGTAKTTCC